jgi:hypothetical protein
MGARMIGIDERLCELWQAWRDKPFQWGTADCTVFARDAAWRLHGLVVDVPPYVSEREAARLLADHFGCWQGALRRAGFELQGSLAAMARRGDLVVYDSERPGLFSTGLAVVFGDKAYCPSEAGLAAVPRSQWLQVWAPKGTA